MTAAQRTPLFDLHRQLGAHMTEFAGYEMPVRYGSIRDEHTAVRERAGLFDVSHMGQLHVSGAGAVEALERLLTCRVASLRPGRVRYGLLCNERGGVVDDVTVYRVEEREFFLCVNAANRDKDRAWLEKHATSGTRVSDRSAETALLALQGPASVDVLDPLASFSAAGLRPFAFADGEIAGIRARVSRTGYTGADGFEIYAPAHRAAALFERLLEAGGPQGIRPAGLGARDTLRLEAALPLYGHELDDETTPLEARLERFVKLEHGGFLGAEALAAQRAAGVPRLLVGFVLEARGIARAGYALLANGARVGSVTSGAPSPTLGKSIGLGYVPPTLAAVDTPIDVEIRGQRVAARVVETPFVKRSARPIPAPQGQEG